MDPCRLIEEARHKLDQAWAEILCQPLAARQAAEAEIVGRLEKVVKLIGEMEYSIPDLPSTETGIPMPPWEKKYIVREIKSPWGPVRHAIVLEMDGRKVLVVLDPQITAADRAKLEDHGAYQVVELQPNTCFDSWPWDLWNEGGG